MIKVNKIISPDKNIHIQQLIVCYTIPSFLFDKVVKNNNWTVRNNLIIIDIYN